MSGKGYPTKALTRRQTLRSVAIAAAAAQSARPSILPAAKVTRSAARPALSLVSRHLQWTSADHGIEVARRAGFPGIIWTVRRGAHVTLANVTDELPRIVNATRAAGMTVPMIITNVNDADEEGAELIFAAMQKLGIRLYRAAAPRYDYNSPIQPQYDDFHRKLAALVKLNAKYDVTAAFHTHAYADSIGGSAWDLWAVMKDLDPRYVGINYDIGHVTAKGGAGWRESIRAVGSFLHSVSIKDIRWVKLDQMQNGQWPWRTQYVAPGQGMVDFPDFFRYLQSINFGGPIETYFEYLVPLPGLAKPFDMLGTDYGQWKLEIPQDMFVGLLRRDVEFYDNVWTNALTTPAPPPFSMKAPG